MYFGGSGWQFGKRKVSAMSNEETNKTTPQQFMQKLNSELKGMIPSMQQGMRDMTPLVKTSMLLFGEYIREAIKAFPQVVEKILESGGDGSPVDEVSINGKKYFLSNLQASMLLGLGTLIPRKGGTLEPFIKTTKGATIPAGLQGYLEQQKPTPQEVFQALPVYAIGEVISSHNRNKRLPVGATIADGKVQLISRLQALIKAKETAEIRKTARTQDVQKFLTVREKTPQFKKRKAGQSQRMEKTRLIKLIRNERIRVSKGPRGRTSRTHIRKVQSWKRALAVLVSRYQF